MNMTTKQSLAIFMCIAIVSACFNFYYVGQLKEKENQFQEALQYGRQEIIQNIVNQLQTTGELRIKVGETAEGDQIIQLRPVK